MKKFPCLVAVSLIMISICHAQSYPPVQLNLKAPPANVAVDANLKEWGDSLSYYSPEERINYTIANSKDTLYLAVKIVERSEIARVLNGGLTFSIDTKGKKKESFSLTYPVNVQGSTSLTNIHMGDVEDSITQDQRDELLSERITSLRGIKQTGFKDIEDDMITTSNTYGIQASFDYDAAGNLVYEEAIPLKFFHADVNAKTLWAFNLKINGLQHPENSGDSSNGGGGGGGRHGGGGGGGGHRGGGGGRHSSSGSNSSGSNSSSDQGADRAELFKSVDFWGKFYLAQ